MGYISNVRDAKDILEKLYKSNNNNKRANIFPLNLHKGYCNGILIPCQELLSPRHLIKLKIVWSTCQLSVKVLYYTT